MILIDTEQDRCEATARTWVARLLSDDVDEETVAAFKTWQAAHPDHASAFERARMLFINASHFEDRFRPKRRHRWPRIAMGLAASLAIGLSMTQPEFLLAPDYVSPQGPAKEFALAEGTKVMLDGGSAIDVTLTPKGRAVTLLRGRAYFHVVHDASKPFTVETRNGVVTDIGTAFTVAQTGSGGEVHVTHGVVRIDAHGRQRTLTAGKAAMWNREEIQPVSTGKNALAWTVGEIIIGDTTLANAARQMDPYIPGRVVILGEVANARVGGTFKTKYAWSGLTGLAKSQGARVRSIGGMTIISHW